MGQLTQEQKDLKYFKAEFESEIQKRIFFKRTMIRLFVLVAVFIVGAYIGGYLEGLKYDL